MAESPAEQGRHRADLTQQMPRCLAVHRGHLLDTMAMPQQLRTWAGSWAAEANNPDVAAELRHMADKLDELANSRAAADTPVAPPMPSDCGTRTC
jgi:hypothetical protein